MKSVLQIQRGSWQKLAFPLVFFAMLFASSSLYSQNCNDRLAYWSLDGCHPNSDYSEFTANTTRPSGFSHVSGSILANDGSHSCTAGVSGAAPCAMIRTTCTWSDNSNDAYTFSVTISPQSGYEVCLSQLTFYERAPLTYSHLSGNTGDNDPPSRYGWRILKNGQEIGQWTGKHTTHDWSLESFDFASLGVNTTVTSQTTFKFEVLGYCRSNGTSGLAVWDIDEVKVYGCAKPTTPPDPCANQGGDSDNDGVCDNQDCRPHNPNISNPGDACNDGNSNTTNDVIQNDCSCQGTTAPPPPSGCNATVSVSGNTITVNNISGAYSEVNFLNASWQVQQTCSSWSTACGTSTSYTAPSNGTYYVLIKTYDSNWSVICNETETVTVSGGTGPACSINVTYGNIVCDGKGTSTVNDDTFTVDVTVSGSNTSNQWNGTLGGQTKTGSYGTTTTFGPFNTNSGSTISGWFMDKNDTNCDFDITVTPPNGCSTTNPCANQGGDSDGDGVCDNQDCRPNNPNISNPGDACNDGDSNTTNDIIQSDCSCAGTPTTGGGCNATVAVSGNTITVSGLTGTYKEVNFLDASWQSIDGCSSWGSSPCGANPSTTVSGGGTYYVLIKSYNSSWGVICNLTETVTVGGTPPPPPGVCSVSATVSNIQCNDRGTSNAGDDTFTFTVTATISNGGPWGYDIEGTNINMVTNGGSTSVNGGAISGGTRTYKVFDHDDPNCFTNITVTPPAPCSSGGTVYDCPALNANIGDSCNDGNPNTTNDQVQSNCTCAGTPTGGGSCNATVTTSGNKVTVTGLSGAWQQVIVSDASWNTVFQCDNWGGTSCGSSPSFTATSSGTYYVTVKSYTSAWSTICDIFKTVTLSGGGGGNTVCADRTATNSNGNCGSGTGYGFYAQDWIYGAGGLNNLYDFQNGKFVEYTNGTARLTGTAVNRSNGNVRFAVDVTFTGRTNDDPNSHPKDSDCYNANFHGWYFYTGTNGTLTGEGAVAGAVVNVGRDGSPFQIGTGANLNDRYHFGASGWLTYTIVSQPNNSAIQIQGGNKRLDFNLKLSGNASACANYTSRVVATGFDVNVKDGVVDLTWMNNSGAINDYFEVERSKDGITFEPILNQPTLTTDNTPKFYQRTDGNPFVGYNYYRLKLTHLDGSEYYSEIKQITISDIEDFGLFPNPAQETVKVSLRGYEGKDIQIQLINQFGKSVKVMNIDKVSDSVYQVELNNVRNGMYSLWIFAEGRKAIGKKVIVNKMY